MILVCSMAIKIAMSSYSVAQAKNGLPSLIDKALAGEKVVITRRGQKVVELRVCASDEPAYGSVEWLLGRPRPRLRSDISTTDLIREMRDEGY